jgi:hypothetical protein
VSEKRVDPLGNTELSEPGALPRTALSMPPQSESVALPAVAPAGRAPRAGAWTLALAGVAGVATAVALAYALR